MAATAAALLEWQPLFVLEKENYALREENRHLRFRVDELMQWKERALRQMVALGPKRARARQDVQHAAQLQKKLQTVEKSLTERRALEDHNALLHEKETLQAARVAQLETHALALEARAADAAQREQRTRVQLQHMADAFRVHLEQLVAIRERIDSDGGGDSNEMPPASEDRSPGEEQEQQQQQQEPIEAHGPSVLIAGLAAVSDKCLRWFHQHVAQAFAATQQKAALYEAQHSELQTLRARVLAIRHDVDASVAKDKQQTQQLVKWQRDHAELEREVQKLRSDRAAETRGRAAMGDHVRLLVTEVRQYLRLVRAEIKKKFGYVPDAISHADHWARILDALDALERQLRIAAGVDDTARDPR